MEWYKLVRPKGTLLSKGASASPPAPVASSAVPTLTRMPAGLRIPAFAKAFTSRVCVAEKRPVRRCLGSFRRMSDTAAEKPMSSSVSASSSTNTSSPLTSRISLCSTSSIRPGVPTSTSAPLLRRSCSSCSTSVPPVSSTSRRRTFPPSSPAAVMASMKWRRTRWVCAASSRVGLRISAPTWPLLSAESLLSSICNRGSTNARVLPLPVTASTRTSL
mmetsp:Transcript_18308/g.69362  ORF Transcript_18308/g.69362 Transcript_18308/m.69362 type:complete len:217 (+) Transcript_18308:780-1430(+)